LGQLGSLVHTEGSRLTRANMRSNRRGSKQGILSSPTDSILSGCVGHVFSRSQRYCSYSLSIQSLATETKRQANCGYLQKACRAYDRSSNRSEEHTSELQSLTNLVCRLLLEKKK